MHAWQKILTLLPPDLLTSRPVQRLLPLLGQLASLREFLDPALLRTIGFEAAWQQLTLALREVATRDRMRVEGAVLTFWDALRAAFNHPVVRDRAAAISIAVIDALRASRQPLLDWLQQPEHLDQIVALQRTLAPMVRQWFESLATDTLLSPDA